MQKIMNSSYSLNPVLSLYIERASISKNRRIFEVLLYVVNLDILEYSVYFEPIFCASIAVKGIPLLPNITIASYKFIDMVIT